MAFAREFTGYSLPVLALRAAAVKRALDMPLHEGLKIEADLSTLAFRTKDAEEGMAAFEEKRKPEFQRCADGQIIVTGASRGIGAAIARGTRRARASSVVGLSRSGDAPAGERLRCDMTDEAARQGRVRRHRRTRARSPASSTMPALYEAADERHACRPPISTS